MIKTVITPENGSSPVKIWTDDIEVTALNQLERLSTLPFIHKHIAVMPDVHAGIGSTVGTVLPTIGAIVPATVGVDLGCGMSAVKLTLKASDLPESLSIVRKAIEKAIPLGAGGAFDKSNDLWTKKYDLDYFKKSVNLKEDENRLYSKAATQMGTLGSGNHFIEICLDKENNVWVMLHSGSRGIGNIIGRYFINAAKEKMEKWHISLADPDLAYLVEGDQLFDDYVKAVGWAQEYAMNNRSMMMTSVLDTLTEHLKSFQILDKAINCHHNYVEQENHYGKNVYVTRKGAVRARVGDLGIIPGSMGAKSFIVRGKGNPESFCSCSHGAGRKMSRAEAKKRFTVKDMEEQTLGVECRKDGDVIDEIPSAYKSIDEVMDNQSDLVEIVAELKQIMCVKG